MKMSKLSKIKKDVESLHQSTLGDSRWLLAEIQRLQSLNDNLSSLEEPLMLNLKRVGDENELLRAEVERLRWFEENFNEVHQGTCVGCGCGLVPFCEREHADDCEYIKHRSKT